MKSKAMILVFLMTFLAGCQSSTTPSATATPSGSSQTKDEVVDTTNDDDLPVTQREWIIDPPYDFDVDTMVASDFGDYFQTDYEGSTTTTYQIGEGTPWENTVTTITGAEEGATIYIIAGVHGDEEAAWRAGDLLEKISIKAGTLYVIAPANPWGAYAEPQSRYVVDSQDLNRSFPGDPDGLESEQVAHIIFQDVIDKSPDFVFDLHEARMIVAGYDFLGSCLIFTDLSEMGDMFMGMIIDSEMGELFSEPLNYYSPGPEGSVNRVITEQLGIPTITTETFRGYEMETRIADQLDVVNYALEYYGLVG